MSSLTTINLLFFVLPASLALACAALFDVINNCPFTVWGAASPSGGMQLNSGQNWSFNVPAGTVSGRIWARTNCQFDESGRGHCETGDCDGLLHCQGFGATSNTIAEYALNQVMNQDFFDLSVVDGFNVPIEFSSTSGWCNVVIQCNGNILAECPPELRIPGGCNGPCPMFKTDQYCCNSGICGPTNYSRFFKDRCPRAFSFPLDDRTSTFTCPSGTNYKVVFCP